MWNEIFSTLATAIIALIAWRRLPANFRDLQIALISSAAVWLISVALSAVEGRFSQIFEVLLMSFSLSLILVAYLMFIRREKPSIFRYPYYMAFVPALIPIAHLIAIDIEIIRQVIFMSLHAVAIIIFIVITFGYFYYIENKLLHAIAVLSLLWGFAFFWILKEFYVVFNWAWGLSYMVGAITAVYVFSELVNKLNNELQA